MEAVALPAIFLTVALLGGLRIAETVRLLPPSLTALVLGLFLLGTLVRGGVLVPATLVHGARTSLENVSGVVVLLALFAASAQAINLLLPERGLLHAAFALFLGVQLMTMNASGAGRVGVLRSLLVLCGSLFVLRFVLVEALYAPGGGLLHRLLTTLMSGASLGGIHYQPHAPATGYVAFCTLMLYMLGLVLLPKLPARGGGLVVHGSHHSATLPSILACLLALPLVLGAGCGGSPAERAPAPQAAPATDAVPAKKSVVSAEQRAAALRSAKVWQQAATPIAKANLKINPVVAGAFADTDTVECRLVLEPMSGTTPKFDCEREGGDVIRVKYGRGNPELYSEVATTRLLAALGFGADRVFLVKQVHCAGCTPYPFQRLRCLADTGTERACFPAGVDHTKATTFADAVIERRLPGRRIEATRDQGWAWYELGQIDAAHGGASRAEVDALKLMAVLIAHWDNKAENQRLVCLPGGDQPDGGCSRPLALLQDVGASFGPMKLDLNNWRALPVWSDPATCRVSMEQLPWGGGTFPEQQISEAGRQFLLALLDQLSLSQVRDLFDGARVYLSSGVTAESQQPAAWAVAFKDKVRQIREAGPCPGG